MPQVRLLLTLSQQVVSLLLQVDFQGELSSLEEWYYPF